MFNDEINQIDIFCKGNEGQQLSDYEKKRLQNLKRNYEVFKSVGITVNLPRFMQPDKKKVKKDLNRFNGSVFPKTLHPVHSVPGKLETKRKQKISKCNFIQFILKDAEAYLMNMDNYISQTKLMDNTHKKNEIDCDICVLKFKEDCPIHGPMSWMREGKNDTEKSTGALPHFSSISGSSIPKAGLGVWTELPLPQGFVFGPYKGRVTRNIYEAQKNCYAWPVSKGQSAHHYIQVEDKGDSSWIQYVRCASREEQKNLVSFQYKKHVFYRTCKAVQPFTELLVWNGNEYAGEVGIDTTKDKCPKNLPSQKNIEGLECDNNFAQFTTPSAIEGHRRTHNHVQPDRSYRCHRCSYSTNFINNLQRHHSHHMVERTYLCSICGKAFHQLDDLQRHKMSHSGDKGFECDICLSLFSTPSALKGHRRTHPHMQSDRKHRCHQCSYSTDRRSDLRDHLLTHSGERPHMCTHCHKSFTQKNYLRIHLLRHSEERPYRCSTCDKAFKSVWDLQRHKKNHSGEKPCICPICGKGFKTSSNLNRHEWVHTRQSRTGARTVPTGADM